MTDNIESFGIHADNAKLVTPEQCLRDCLKRLHKEGDRFNGINKILVIGLDDKNGKYSVGFNQAGMTASQMLSLMEVLKAVVLDLMGF